MVTKPCKDTSKGKIGKKSKRLSDRRNAHSLTLKSLPSGSNPSTYRTPGSMKGN